MTDTTVKVREALEAARQWINDNLHEGDIPGCTALSEVSNALSALDAATVGRVSVKPLEWNDRETDEPDVIGSGARTSIGDYWTSWDGREEKRWVLYFGQRQLPERYHLEAEAKAAAQADYEARIRAALSLSEEPTQARWQEMGTAPKRGRLLGFVDGEVRFIYWGKTSHVPLYGWNLGDQGAEDCELCQPTHWMPLPSEPRP